MATTTHHKVTRFRLRPTKAQEAAMLRQAGACRWVWNWGLARRIEHYKATGKTLTSVALSRELTEVKRREGMGWINEVSRQCLTEALRNLDRAFANFFARRTRYPRFKARKRWTPAFRCQFDVRMIGDRIQIPKTGRVRVRNPRPLDGTPGMVTFKRDASGRWYVSFIVKFQMPDVGLPPPDPACVVGVDLGLKSFAVLSTGETIATPKFFAKAMRQLRKAQRAVSRRHKGSRRREKAKRRADLIHAKVKDKRGDFLHKLSTRVVREHEGIVVEDLCVKGLARTKLARGVMDAAWSEFRRQLTYKATWHRRHLVVVDRWFPSTRLCRGCGAVNAALTLKDRSWTCQCGMHHDRDLSAAINIRDEGLKRLAAGHAESLNARGVCVRPATAGNG